MPAMTRPSRLVRSRPRATARAHGTLAYIILAVALACAGGGAGCSNADDPAVEPDVAVIDSDRSEQRRAVVAGEPAEDAAPDRDAQLVADAEDEALEPADSGPAQAQDGEPRKLPPGIEPVEIVRERLEQSTRGGAESRSR